MSTKSSLAHGPAFHLYREAFGDDAVYLELEGAQFEASPDRVLLAIPPHVWEFIRRFPGTSFEYVEKTDAELMKDVTRQVDERLREYQAENPKAKAVAGLWGGVVYGSIDSPREQQIAAGFAHFSKIRTHQQEIQHAIAELEKLNRSVNDSLQSAATK